MLREEKHPLANHKLFKLPVLGEDNLGEVVEWLEWLARRLPPGEVSLEVSVDEEDGRLYENVGVIHARGGVGLVSGAQGLKRYTEAPQPETVFFFAAPLMLEVIRRLKGSMSNTSFQPGATTLKGLSDGKDNNAAGV